MMLKPNDFKRTSPPHHKENQHYQTANGWLMGWCNITREVGIRSPSGENVTLAQVVDKPREAKRLAALYANDPSTQECKPTERWVTLR